MKKDGKILIIDDNEQDRKIIKRYVGKAGYENIVMAETGNEGVEKAESEKPDLIILDTVLPDTVGFEVCKKIREFGDMKIIMMTGTIDAVDAVKARGAGADDYCVKTPDCSPLMEAIDSLCNCGETE